MFDVALPEYDDAAFYTAEEQGAARRTALLTERLASRMVIDPRLSLAVFALALGFAASGTALLMSFAAFAALVLGVVMRPRPQEARYGAFNAVELGFLVWCCDPRGPLASAASIRATAAFAVFGLGTLATLGAGVAGLAPQVVLCGAVAFAALITTRLALADLVRG